MTIETVVAWFFLILCAGQVALALGSMVMSIRDRSQRGWRRWASHAPHIVRLVGAAAILWGFYVFSSHGASIGSMAFACGSAQFLNFFLWAVLMGGRPGWRKWASSAGVIIAMVGAAGFLGIFVSAMGELNWLPESFEWPVGYASGVVSTDSGLAIVPHTPSGRVQIYGAEWEYVRGWHIGSGGTGPFALRVSDDSAVEVLTVRGRLHKKFDLNGRLISEVTFPKPDPDSGSWFYRSYPDHGVSVSVPTPFWLMPFASPGIAWMTGVAGMALAISAQTLGTKREPGNSGTD